ncbi:putative protein MULTIPOLAR SPINDLE 1 [Helianthus anomalus]
MQPSLNQKQQIMDQKTWIWKKINTKKSIDANRESENEEEELNQRKSSYARASRLILSKGKNTESVEGITGSLSLHLVRKMCTTLQANGKFGSMQTTTTTGSDEPLKLALAMALLRSKLVNKTSETSHPPSDTSSSEALKWKHKV